MYAAATVTGGLERAGLKFGDNIVIQGAGLLGLYAAVLAKERGARQIVVIDIIPERLALAKEFGADHIFNVQEICDIDLVEKIKDENTYVEARRVFDRYTELMIKHYRREVKEVPSASALTHECFRGCQSGGWRVPG